MCVSKIEVNIFLLTLSCTVVSWWRLNDITQFRRFMEIFFGFFNLLEGPGIYLALIQFF